MVRFIRHVLDHARTADFFPSFDAWAEVILRLDADAGSQGVFPILAIAVRYLYRVLPEAAEPLVQALERINAKGFKEIAMNTYDQAIEIGEKRALLRAREEARQLLLRQCTKRFGAVPVKAQALIQTADHETLGTWFDNVVTAQTLDEVFGDRVA